MLAVVNAKCPTCGAALPIVPGSEYATCVYCGASSLIQKRDIFGRATAPAYGGQQVVNIPNGKTQVAAVLIIFSTIGFALLLAVVSAVIVRARATATTPTIPRPAPVVVRTPATAPKPVPEPALSACDYYCDAAPLAARLKGLYSAPFKATKLVVYPEYASITAQDPARLDHLDSYFVRRTGGRADPKPELFDKRLKSQLFAVDTVDFAAVPRMAKDALARAKNIEEPNVTHMILDIEANRGVFRVYVTGPRGSVMLDYDDHGKFRRVH